MKCCVCGEEAVGFIETTTRGLTRELKLRAYYCKDHYKINQDIIKNQWEEGRR